MKKIGRCITGCSSGVWSGCLWEEVRRAVMAGVQGGKSNYQEKRIRTIVRGSRWRIRYDQQLFATAMGKELGVYQLLLRISGCRSRRWIEAIASSNPDGYTKLDISAGLRL